jgi:hypothetical protein
MITRVMGRLHLRFLEVILLVDDEMEMGDIIYLNSLRRRTHIAEKSSLRGHGFGFSRPREPDHGRILDDVIKLT